MKASTPRTSRLAAVASARRRQRKERLSSGSPIAAHSPLAAKNTLGVSSPLAARSPMSVRSPAAKRNIQTHEPAALELAASSGSTFATNQSNIEHQDSNNENINNSNTLQTLPTDDESISTWSQAQSTISGFTDDSFGFIPAPKSRMPTSITSRNGRKPKNITVITEEVLSPSSPHNILSPCAESSNITFRAASPRVFSPRTPKMTNGPVVHREDNNPRSMLKLIDELTQERDRLRLDSNLFRRKLQEANDAKMAIVQEKDERIADLMKNIGNLTVLIDEAESEKERNGEMFEASNSKSVKELEAELSETVCQLNKLRGSYELLKRVKQLHSSKSCATKAEKELKELEEELLQVILEKDEMAEKFDECMDELERYNKLEDVNEKKIKNQTATIDKLKKQLEGKEELESNFDECVEELGRVQGAEEKHQATIQRQTAQIESLKTSLAKLKAELAQKDTKISEILDEKFESETALQERIYRLESEIKSLSNGHKEDKSNYECMIKALKEQLNTANQSCEEEKASLVKGMEEMKDGFTQSIDVYKQKVADLESRLDLATQQNESITKEFSDTKSLFAMRLEECNREKNEVVSKLEQANKEYGSAKAARGKDINMLESELEKALASKLETDKQLKDTRRQLHNALHSLDAMSIDGGKTRADLEDIMKHLNTEKDLLHRELVELRYQTEEQKNTIKYLNLDKRRCEESCDALRSKIRELEAKGHFGSSDEREMMQLEIKYLKNMLDKANTINSSSMKCGKNESNRALEEQVEQLRASEKSRAAELSQARQMIQKLKTKEKYLESRVESLANQITLTVQEYETRLGEAREMGHI